MKINSKSIKYQRIKLENERWKWKKKKTNSFNVHMNNKRGVLSP